MRNKKLRAVPGSWFPVPGSWFLITISVVGVGVAESNAAQTGSATSNQQSTTRVEKTVAAPPSTDDEKVNPDALALFDFKKRIDAYVALQKKAAKSAPAMKETTDPEQIKVAQEALAQIIQALRSTARAGDIFTPAIQTRFRKLLVPELKGDDGRDAREILKDDAPPSVPLKVNARYPEGASMPTVPVEFLLSLPTLPEELEYRIINKHLILRDTKANIVVDYIPNVIR